MTAWSSSSRLGDDAHGIALDGRLRLRESLADALRELLGLLAGQAALERDLLANGATAGRLDLAPLEDLEAQASPHGLRLEQILRRAGAIVVVGREGDRVLAQLEGDLAALEIVARRDLAARLVQRVDQLLLVEVAHHVERRISCHDSPILPISRTA